MRSRRAVVTSLTTRRESPQRYRSGHVLARTDVRCGGAGRRGDPTTGAGPLACGVGRDATLGAQSSVACVFSRRTF